MPPADSLCPRHQTTLETDPSPEEILRQAGCKQQPAEGVEHVEGARQRQARLPEEGWLGRWGGCWKRNQQSRHLRAPENLSMFISHKHPKDSLNQIWK